MTFAPFDWSDFVAPLDPSVVAMAIILGIAFGAVMARLGMVPPARHTWFMLSAGVVFYIPLAVLRSAEGSPVWERFLATLVLWTVFLVGVMIGNRARRRHGRP